MHLLNSFDQVVFDNHVFVVIFPSCYPKIPSTMPQLHKPLDNFLSNVTDRGIDTNVKSQMVSDFYRLKNLGRKRFFNNVFSSSSKEEKQYEFSSKRNKDRKRY